MTESKALQGRVSEGDERAAVSLAAEIIESFGLSDLHSLLQAIEARQRQQDLNIAVLGRFKAGKSSFLNQIIGKPVLPVGVVPVTSVVTEIRYGREEYAELVLAEGKTERIPVEEIGEYVSEAGNPRNAKGVESVRVFLPSLARFQGIRFVDTPGMESVFAHNTETSLSWSPNADLAVVAVGVDPPLTQQDISLIEHLGQYTPNVSVLLTKADTLSEHERHEVEEFVGARLRERFGASIRVFPYSIRPGYEDLRQRFEREQIRGPLASAHEQRQGVLRRKLATLFRSARDYLELALKAEEIEAAQRDELRAGVLGSPESLADQKLQFQLIARHGAGQTRAAIEAYIQKNTQSMLEKNLKARLERELPGWRGGFADTLSAFERWLRGELEQELSAISAAHHHAFCGPLQDVERRCQASLQAFRDQLSEKAMRVFGLPLRTTETEIEVQPPRSPDISVGKVFDHSWEVVSFLVPMPLVRWAVNRRFRARVEREVYKNLSRLTTQWEERVRDAIYATAAEATKRLDELVLTVSHLLAGEDQQGRQRISACLARVKEAADQIEKAKPEAPRRHGGTEKSKN